MAFWSQYDFCFGGPRCLPYCTLRWSALELADKLASIGLSLLKVDAFTDSESNFRECLAIREKVIPNVKCHSGQTWDSGFNLRFLSMAL